MFRPYEGFPKNNNSWAVVGILLMKDFYSCRNKADNASGCHYGKIKQQNSSSNNNKMLKHRFIIHHFYIALFSALKQTHCAHVSSDSE